MNRTQKGNDHRRKTKKWLEGEGYIAEYAEISYRIHTKGKVIFKKSDLWGADILALKDGILHAIQVKANKGDIAKGIKELCSWPWPLSTELLVVHWPVRRRFTEGPDIIEVRGR